VREKFSEGRGQENHAGWLLTQKGEKIGQFLPGQLL
jgi:hypothetical protein